MNLDETCVMRLVSTVHELANIKNFSLGHLLTQLHDKKFVKMSKKGAK